MFPASGPKSVGIDPTTIPIIPYYKGIIGRMCINGISASSIGNAFKGSFIQAGCNFDPAEFKSVN